MKKRKKAATPRNAHVIDSVATMQAELDEFVELARPHYPEATDRELRARAEALRRDYYAEGRWPDFAAMAREEAAAQAAKEEARAREEAASATVADAGNYRDGI